MLSRARASWPFRWSELVALAGLLLLGGGLYLWSVPVALVVVGVILLVVGWLSTPSSQT